MQEIDLNYVHAARDSLKLSLPTGLASFEISTYGGFARLITQAGQRSCTTHCSTQVVSSLSPDVPTFMAYFEEAGKRIAWGTSPTEVETIAAIAKWLQGSSLDVLHTCFEFVDREKRNLLEIQRSVSKELSSLGDSVQIEIKEFNIWSALWFHGQSRAVVVNGSSAEACFSWDQCILFKCEVSDHRVLAALIQSWLCDNAAPSAMRVLFPWLEIGKLADDYENGNAVDGEFFQTWNEIEQFIRNEKMQFPQRIAVLQFIAEFRRAGYDKLFRAGFYGQSLIFSRSRRHGLRADQQSIQYWFKFPEGTMLAVIDIIGMKRSTQIPIAFSGQVEQDAQRLANLPID